MFYDRNAKTCAGISVGDHILLREKTGGYQSAVVTEKADTPRSYNVCTVRTVADVPVVPSEVNNLPLRQMPWNQYNPWKLHGGGEHYSPTPTVSHDCFYLLACYFFLALIYKNLGNHTNIRTSSSFCKLGRQLMLFFELCRFASDVYRSICFKESPTRSLNLTFLVIESHEKSWNLK